MLFLFRSFPKFGRDGRKPKVKSNLRAGLANAGGHNKRFPSAAKSLDKPSLNTKLVPERQRKKVFITEKPLPAPNSFDEDEEADHNMDEDLFVGPEVRPDGRMARVKADILAENQNKPEATAPAPSLEPFIEAFFASPSSPKPFVFTGSPRPADQFGSASTFQPFFVPTAKSISSSPAPEVDSDDSDYEESNGNKNAGKEADNLESNDNDEDNEIEVQTTTTTEHQTAAQPVQETAIPRPRNRFLSRPSPAAVTARQQSATSTAESVHSEDSKPEESAVDEMKNKSEIVLDNKEKHVKNNDGAATSGPGSTGRTTGFRQRQFIKPASPTILVGREEECTDPFSCPKSENGDSASDHRPRVKSNITAKKRNFWQKDAATAPAETTGRKLRRGRKQKTPVEEEVENDILDEPAIADKKSVGASLLDELMAGKKEVMDEVSTTGPNHIQDTNRPLFPATGTELKTQQEASTTTSKPSDAFRDLFEEEEEEEEESDLIVSSSTVSAVIFKGSPTPSPFGFFSSPQPDWDGPSRASIPGGGFAGSPRPSFSNIGNDIHLGPEKKPFKILPLDQLFFVSSTQSNKIVIGSEDDDAQENDEDEEESEEADDVNEGLITTTVASKVTTTPIPLTPTAAAAVEAAKRPSPFPSFPIRGKLPAGATNLSFPFRQTKLGKVQKETATEIEEKIEGNETTLSTTSSTTTAEQTSLTSATSTTTRFSAFNRGGRPNNLAFLSRKTDVSLSSTTSKVESIDQTSTAGGNEGSDEDQASKETTSTVSNVEAAVTTLPETSSILKLPQKSIGTVSRFPQKPQLSNGNFPSGPPGRSRNLQPGRKELGKETATISGIEIAAVDTTAAPEFAATEGETSSVFATTTEINVLSVESILGEEDDTENELDSNVADDDDDETGDDENSHSNADEEDEEEKHVGESRNFEKKLVTKQRQQSATAAVVPSVKKALGPPPNANIRVEFKKATALQDSAEDEGTKKFFVKPDGRKPRVKSNIRSVETQ
jgi:hypothetical protein